MEIDLNKKNSTEASIKIRLNKTDYQPQVDKKVQEYAKKMNLKGFRPGKVPAGMVRKMYGKSILVEEVNHILGHKLQDYIRENDLKILAEPIPDAEATKAINWDTQEDFEFVYNVGLEENFKLELSDKHKITKYAIKVDKKALDTTLADIRERFGKDTEGETAEENDTLEVNVSVPSIELEKYEVNLSLKELDKKGAKNFIGKKKEDVVKIDVAKLTKDAQIISSLTGLTPEAAVELKGDIEITLKGIKRKIEAEVNQELFDQVFGAGVVSNEEEYTNKVKETIEANYDRESDNFLNLSIRKYFLEKTALNLPENFLKEWLKLRDEKLTDEDLDREFGGYADSIKWDLMMKRIEKDQEIKISYSDVKERAIKMFIEQFGGEQAVESIKDQLDAIADNYLQGEEGKNYSNLYSTLLNEKTFEVIKEKVTITDKKVSVDEFTKIVNE